MKTRAKPIYRRSSFFKIKYTEKEEFMIKKILAAAALISSVFFASGQSLGTDETTAIREFFEAGSYIEYRNSSGQYVIKSQDKIIGIRESKDKKSTVEIIDVNGNVDSVSWSEITADANRNLLIVPKMKSDKQVITNQMLYSRNLSASGGKRLTIYSWNEEFLNLLMNYYPEYRQGGKIGNIDLEYIVIPSYEYYEFYTENILSKLEEQNSEGGKNQIDIFLLEPEYVKQLADSPYILDINDDLGFTDEDLSKQFKYIKDMGTIDGKLKALSWQCNPSGIIYRRSIAKSVFGTDDPDKIQELLSDWDKFNAAAKELKENGFYIVSGFEDTFRAFQSGAKTPWVIDGKLNIDSSILDWISQQNEFAEDGLTQGYEMWSEEFFSGMMDDGMTFCYLGPNWFIDYIMTPYSQSDFYENNTYGDWAFCKGPQGFDWGGSFICVAKGTDNLPLIKNILEKLTMDDGTMTKIAAGENVFVNNEKVMESIAKGRNGKGILGGQDNLNILIDSAKSMDRSASGPYDYELSEMLKSAMKPYFKGSLPLDLVWRMFFSSVKDKFPDLKIPEQLYY